MKLKRASLLVVALLNVGLIASGCGKSSGQTLVQGVQLSSHQDSGDLYVSLKSQLNTGATQFASLEVTVQDPKHPGETFGSLALRQAFNGTAEVVLDLNVSKITRYQFADGSHLPNGTPIPVGGLGSTPVIGIPIGNNGSMIYVAYGNGVAMIGTAIVIKEFNNMGGYVGNVNIFPMFDFGSGVRGLGGVFAGLQSGQSGIALFVDASTAVSASAELAPASAGKSIQSAKAALELRSASRLTFISPAVSQSKKDKVNSSLYKLHRKKAKLHMQ